MITLPRLLLFSLALILFAASLASPASAQIPEKRYDPDLNPTSTNPYGLVDLDGFDSPGYPLSKYGILLSLGTALPGQTLSLPFTPLSIWTGGLGNSPTTPVPLSETDMFANNGLSELAPDPSLYHAYFASAIPPLLGQPAVTRIVSLATTTALMRRFHFPRILPDALHGGNFGDSTKKLIVLVHGWNPKSDPDSYDEPDDDKQFHELHQNLMVALANAPDWSIVLYHWERDADTGPKNLNAAVNGTEAAEAAHRHGQHLGQLIEEETHGGIQKVHFIAHSAGSWVARAATKYLLSRSHPVTTQITLLDPFIPGVIDHLAFYDTVLEAAQMRAIDQFPGAVSLFLLENYYAVDATPFFEDFALGTQEEFEWRAGDVDKAVDRLVVPFSPRPYKNHEGPIQYYADTVLASSGTNADQATFTRLAFAGLGTVVFGIVFAGVIVAGKSWFCHRIVTGTLGVLAACCGRARVDAHC